MSSNDHTASDLNLVNCLTCGLLCKPYPASTRSVVNKCPRCGALLDSRKKNSIVRTWALLISAAILYVPANMLPIMTVTEMGKVQSDTIVSGVFFLIQTGQWPLALLVFFASVVVPILKLVVLGFLMLSLEVRSTKYAVERTKLYRLTEKIGRWSMVDIYVVTILVALVQLGAIANVEAEIGAVFFGAVVVLTMFAANAFDPRLIWDRAEGNGENTKH